MHKGLTSIQAADLIRTIGPNKISEQRNFSLIKKTLAEFFGFLNLLLLAAAVLSYIVGHFPDAILILLIVILNTLTSVWQETKAENTLNELKKLNYSLVRTMRDGVEVLLSSDKLVPGDLVFVEVGDKIPADGVVVETLNLEINESALTGESVSVYKKTGEKDHQNVHAGTMVSAGRANIKITTTGNNTRFGQISQTLKNISETNTPLQRQIKDLSIKLGGLAVAASTVIYFIGISSGQDKFTMFFTGISAAVALVPEGLPSIILITLAVGIKRMAIQKAVVRKMLAIEGLGSVNVICTDKTGTLTEGRMNVDKLWFEGTEYDSIDFRLKLAQKNAERIIDTMVLVNTSSLAHKVDHSEVEVLGDPTEGALLMYARDLGFDAETHRAGFKVLDEFSFDQTSKTMSSVVHSAHETIGLIKGSPERLVSQASHMIKHGELIAIKEIDRQILVAAYEKMAAQGLRVLGFGYKHLEVAKRYDREDVESGITILGFAGLADPPKPEAKVAIQKAKMAGIRTVMITGDNELTAMNIAVRLGLAVEGDEVILGRDLEKFSDEQLAKLLSKVQVFARTNPEDKLRIVKAYQAMNNIVAVTGDGVNDSLALKQAEIGIAMGKKGTEVAKEAADIVITDDNYATIIKAIEEGRTIYVNVLKSIRYLVSTNIAEVLTILFTLVAGLPSPLLPVQILWINLISDGLPAIALSLDDKDPDAMNRSPRVKTEKLLDKYTILQLFGIGIIVAAFTFAVFWWHTQNESPIEVARAWTFTALILMQLAVAFIIHGKKSPSLKLIGATAITLAVQAIILFTPALHSVFKIGKIW